MNIFIKIVKWIVGLLFIFSGVIKTIDPMGLSIKLEEYLEVFNLLSLSEYTLPVSVFITILEVLLGVFLILGIYRRFTLTSLTLLIIFFTFLTFYSAYFNVVQDCGCFGDAVKLTPWQSFGKDVFLLIMIGILWWGRKYLDLFFTRPIANYVSLGAFLIMAYIAFMGIYHLPLVDFRPYAIGENIIDGMKTAEELGLEPPQYEVKYILKNKLNNRKIKLSEQQYISDKSYWQTGTSWELLSTEEELIHEGYTPPIHDFIIDCGERGDMTYYYLEQPKVIFLLTPTPSKTSVEGMNRITNFSNEVENLDIPVLSIASDNVVIDNLETCLMDATTLKTIIRANPGIVLLKHGTVVGKYHWRDAPSVEKVKALLD
ncbi:MAG: BT_3928 family protein [Weeksellaceae bacterium]